jgi:DNA (cytosine-5)-methyltransferase 1
MRVMDLFAGCGGLTLGFERAGFMPIFAVESDPDAADTYELNFGKHVARNDDGTPQSIESVDQFPAADVVVGGPPCQGFSPLNMRSVGLGRRALWREYLRALDDADPIAFVMENVPELLRSGEYARFKLAAENDLGFRVEGDILNAADYGVAQTRRRAIVIGTRCGAVPWPRQTHWPPSQLGPRRKRWRTFRDAVKGLPREPTGRHWHNPRSPRPTSLERYEAIPS